MDQQKSKDWLPLLTAMAEGKQIQYKIVSETNATCWVNTDKVDLAYPVSYYRVAPKVVKVKSWVIVPKGSNRCSHVHPFPTPEQAASYLLSCYTPDDFVVVEMEGSYER